MTVDVALRPIRADEVMSAPVCTISPDASVCDALALLSRSRIRHLVVAVDGHCVGLVDDRLVVAQWPIGPFALRRQQVAHIMRPAIASVLPTAQLQSVAAVMVRDWVDAVPVVCEDGKVIGLITCSDLARAIERFGVAGPIACDESPAG